MTKEEIRAQVHKLMGQMSVEEKVLQLTCIMPSDLSHPEKLGIENGIGAMPIMGGSPTEIAQQITTIQSYVLEHSRNKIPVLFHCEALSGTFIGGSCQFPLPIGLGASFDGDLVQKMAEINRRQMHAVGIRHALAPVVDVARDLRWGRLGETYGGDPVLCGAMGAAYVRGMQTEDLSTGNAATLKHFLGYSATTGGLNMSQTTVTPRDLREHFARPFEMAIRLGKVKGVMSSYSEYDGKAVCANRALLTDLLREDLGFDGVVVSDYASVERLKNVFGMAEDDTQAGELCLAAGMDMEFPQRLGYSKKMVSDAEEGSYDMAWIDRAVKRVLTLKYELGLFENPYPRMEEMGAFDNTENNKRSLDAARKSMTLTKNAGILPLTDRKTKIAVIGPMGSTLRGFYGCYTLAGATDMMLSGKNAMAGVGAVGEENDSEPAKLDLHAADEMLHAIYPEAKTTVEALRSRFDSVTFTEGCDYIGEDKNDFEAALSAARDADVVIMTLGGRNGWGTYCTSGEGIDSTNIGLPGCQEALLRSVYQVNPNIVLVHTDVRPVISEWVYEHIPAILEAWLPCTYGGIAIAETLTGENNPGGRLPMDVPRSSSHGPVAHYFSRGTETASFRKGAINPKGYVNTDMSAQLPFGYGLSYTDFSYEDFSVTQDEKQRVTAAVRVTNTGTRTGDEVVQLYGVDPVASIVRPAEELLGFQRITLEPGESRNIQFRFSLDILSFYDEPGHWMLEKGEFQFFLGKNCKERIVSAAVRCEENREVDHTKRCLIADVTMF